MIKLFALILALVMVFSLAACSGDKHNTMAGGKISSTTKCWSCNKLVSTSASFCEHCGCSLSQNNNVQSNNSTSDSALEDYASNQNATSNKRQCMWPDCTSTVTRSDSNYCSSHDCSYTACPYPSKYVNGHWGDRCEFHACQVPDCIYAPFSVNGKYCGSHLSYGKSDAK